VISFTQEIKELASKSLLATQVVSYSLSEVIHILDGESAADERKPANSISGEFICQPQLLYEICTNFQ